jgi:hypothetical protein
MEGSSGRPATPRLPYRSGGPASTTPSEERERGNVLGSGAACDAFCPSALACAPKEGCVIADPAGALGACSSVCQSAFGALTPAEANLLAPC